jgi:hypothetical protein
MMQRLAFWTRTPPAPWQSKYREVGFYWKAARVITGLMVPDGSIQLSIPHQQQSITSLST